MAANMGKPSPGIPAPNDNVYDVTEPKPPAAVPPSVEQRLERVERERAAPTVEPPPAALRPLYLDGLRFPFRLSTLATWIPIAGGATVTGWLFMVKRLTKDDTMELRTRSVERTFSTRSPHLPGLAVLSAVTMGLLVSLVGCGSPAAVPKSYSNYESEDGTFKIQYPAGWKKDGGGKGTYAWAKFTSGSASIDVTASVAGSLIGDIAQSKVPGFGGTTEEPVDPVIVVHNKEKAEFERDAGVSEKAPTPTTTAVGASQRAEFTGKRSFGPPVHGYRVTALTKNYRLRVVCQCPETEWKALKPVFDKTIESLGEAIR